MLMTVTDKISSIFDLDEFAPYKKTFNARRAIFSRRAAYYDGTVYDGADWRRYDYWHAANVQRKMRGIFLPLASAVDVDAGIIPAGWAFPDDAPDAWTDARDALFAMSRWDTRGVLYVHYGATFGVVGLRISDLREQGRVIVSAVDPRKYLLINDSVYADSPSMALWVETLTDANGDEYEYAEVYTPDTITTYRNGHQYGYDGRAPSVPNLIGTVPFVETQHIATGSPYSESTFQRAVKMLDEANLALTDLSRAIRRETTNVQWVAYGAEPSELQRGEMWFAPENARIEPLIPRVDISGMMEYISALKEDVVNALPEKDFDELRHKDQIATDSLTIQLTELILKIKRCRPNYDDGLVRAMRIAGKAARSMGLTEIAPLDDDALRLDADRPVIPETPMDTVNRVAKTLETVANVSGEPVPADIALRELGYGDDMVSEFGVAKLAAIRLKQEDVIPEVTQ